MKFSDTINLAKILVPIDGSEPSLCAAKYAAHLAKLSGNSEITLLYVVDMDKEVSSLEQVMMSGYVPQELKNKGYDILYDLKAKLDNSLSINISVQIGEPVDIIVDTAKENDFNLIVMGSRGQSTLKNILLGSVSQYVLKHAPCPVLIVH